MASQFHSNKLYSQKPLLFRNSNPLTSAIGLNSNLTDKSDAIIDYLIEKDIGLQTDTSEDNLAQTLPSSPKQYDGLLKGLKYFQLRQSTDSYFKSQDDETVDDNMVAYLKYKQQKHNQYYQTKQITNNIKRCASSTEAFRPLTQQVMRRDLDKKKNLFVSSTQILRPPGTAMATPQNQRRIFRLIQQPSSSTSLSSTAGSTLNMKRVPPQTSKNSLKVPLISDQQWQQVHEEQEQTLNQPLSGKLSSKLNSKFESEDISSHSITTQNTQLINSNRGQKQPQKRVNFQINVIQPEQQQSKKSPGYQQQKKPASFKRDKTKKIKVSEILGLPQSPQPLYKRATIAHFEQVNDPTDPLYLMKSNYYRNNFVQELEEVKMFGGNPGRVVLTQLISELPNTKFHQDEALDWESLRKIANVRNPLKFKHHSLHRTINYYHYAAGKEINVQDPFPEGYNPYSYNQEYFTVQLKKKQKEKQPKNESVISIEIQNVERQNSGVIERLQDDQDLRKSWNVDQLRAQSQKGKRGGVFIKKQ